MRELLPCSALAAHRHDCAARKPPVSERSNRSPVLWTTCIREHQSNPWLCET
jgi:hypothetical protein